MKARSTFALVIAASSQVNTATISHSDQLDPDASNNARTSPLNPSHPAPTLGIAAMALLVSFLGLVAFLTLRRSVC